MGDTQISAVIVAEISTVWSIEAGSYGRTVFVTTVATKS